MITRLHHPRLFQLLALLVAVCVWSGNASAQGPEARVQKLTGRLRAGEADAYLLRELRAGDRLLVNMQTVSGNLNPIVGIVDDSEPPEELVARYQADVEDTARESANLREALEALRDRYFLAWNDDSGGGYAARLDYEIPADGDYILLAGASFSSLGRTTSGYYELLIALNAPEVTTDTAQPTGLPIAEWIENSAGRVAAVEETTGSITAEMPIVTLGLENLAPGETLYIYVETTAGNLVPSVILRDYGEEPVEAGNLNGQNPQATLEYLIPDGAALEESFDVHAVAYSLDVRGAPLPDGTPTTGDFRVLVGVNEPDVLTGQALPQGETLFDTPIDVQAGIKIHRISAVDSQNENFTVIASLRLDWTDPALAFSPDSCNCTIKLYTEKEFDRFLEDVQSRWPDLSFFNQLGNRWTQSRSAAIWSDGRARYAERFSTTFQADFDFQRFPFDTQSFPIFLDMLYPVDDYTLTELPGYSEIDPAHGEDEFIITDFETSTSEVDSLAADRPVSRFAFTFEAPRHIDYYALQVFVPILLIILISWFTFFLHDYTRRIEAAAANILLFIAFNFTLADNYPRLGYITFLDAIMAVTFVVNVLVLLYNVVMKRLELRGELARVEHIDHILDWTYPLMYVVLVGIVVIIFL